MKAGKKRPSNNSGTSNNSNPTSLDASEKEEGERFIGQFMSIKVFLVFGVLIFSVCITGYSSTNAMSNTFQQTLAESIAEYGSNYLDKFPFLLRSFEYHIRDNPSQTSVLDNFPLRQYLKNFVLAFPGTLAIGISGANTGHMVSVHKFERLSAIPYQVSLELEFNQVNATDPLSEIYMDFVSYPMRINDSWVDFSTLNSNRGMLNISARKWYTDAFLGPETLFSVFPSTIGTGLCISRRIETSQGSGNYTGVVAALFTLGWFSDYLATKLESFAEYSIISYVYDEETGFIMAVSTGESNTFNAGFIPVVQYSNKRIRGVGLFLAEKYGASSIPYRQSLLLGISELVYVNPLETFRPYLNWNVVTIIPVKSVYLHITLYSVLSFFSLLFISLMVFLFTLTMIYFVARPLRSILREMRKIRSFDLKSVSLRLPLLWELRIIVKEFLYTVSVLEKVYSFLPSKMVKRFCSPTGSSASTTSSDDCKSLASNRSYGSDNSNGSFGGGAGGAALKQTVVGVVEKCETFMMIKLAPACDGSTIWLREHGMLLDIISNCISSQCAGGIIEWFRTSLICISFGTFRTNACVIALQIARMAALELKTLSVTILLTFDCAIRGNIGSDSCRQSICEGKAIDELEYILENNLKAEQPNSVFVTDSLIERVQISEQVVHKFKLLAFIQNCCYVWVYRLYVVDAKTDDEWLYRLDEYSKLHEFKRLNQFVDLIKSGAWEKATVQVQKEGFNGAFADVMRNILVDVKRMRSLGKNSVELWAKHLRRKKEEMESLEKNNLFYVPCCPSEMLSE